MDALNPASFLANAFGLIQINLGGGSLRFGQIDGDGRAVAAPIDSDPIASFKFAEEMGVHAQALWTQQRFSRITPRLFLKNYSFDDGRHDGVSARTITASERFDSLLASSVAIHSCQKE